MDWQQVWQTVQDWLTNTGIKLLIAIAIMIVSFALINWLSKKIAKRADKKVEENKKIDKTLQTLGFSRFKKMVSHPRFERGTP